jgi:quercetin dioxygenase-like cupin family protein
MKKAFVILVLCFLGQTAHSETVVSLQKKDLADIPGKEGLMVAVEIAPGESVPKHRHNSDVFVYVLSGTIVTQVQGQPAKTLHAGETFVEAPADIHLDSRNPSKTVPTRLLVFFVKDKGIPPTVYLEGHSSSH